MCARFHRLLPTVVLLLGCCALPPALAQGLKVTPGGGADPALNDGSKWEKALSAAQLAAMLDDHLIDGPDGAGQEFWLMAGVYPTLLLHKGTQIYGGFAGTESARGQRDPEKNQTIIPKVIFGQYWVSRPGSLVYECSGEGTRLDGCTVNLLILGQVFQAPPPGDDDPAYPADQGTAVISGCKLDGESTHLIVEARMGDFSFMDCDIFGSLSVGVAISSPFVTSKSRLVEFEHCQIHDNGLSGVVAYNGASLKMTDCTVTNNGGSSVISGEAPGGINLHDVAAELRGCDFSRNQGHGLSISYRKGSPGGNVVVDHCTIEGNMKPAARSGGGEGVHCEIDESISPERITLNDCRIVNNAYARVSLPLSSVGGGGLYIWGQSIRVTRCIITGNSSSADGGGIYLAGDPEGTGSPEFHDCLIAGNSAARAGGGVYAENSNPYFINCTLDNNHAGSRGGALYNFKNQAYSAHAGVQHTGLVVNCALTRNTAEEGSAVFHDYNRYQSDAEIAARPPDFIHCAYTNDETWTGSWLRPSPENSTTAPLVLDPSTFAVADAGYQDAAAGDYHLTAASVLIDRGDEARVMMGDLDLDRQPRIHGVTVDVGGYEFAGGAVQIAPAFTLQPTAVTISAGENAVFTVAAGGTPTPSLQWQRRPAGSADWSDMADGGVYIGATDSTFTVTAATAAMNGDRFRCVATNAAGSANSIAATLTVAAPKAYTGTYFGVFVGIPGFWALRVGAGGTATYLAFLPDRAGAIIARLTIDPNGAFAAVGREIVPEAEPAGGAAHSAAGFFAKSPNPSLRAVPTEFTLTGQIDPDSGGVAGEIAGLGVTFSGSADAAASPAQSMAGFYVASALNAAQGMSYAIVGPGGQVAVIVTTPALVDGITGTVTSEGRLAMTTAAGGQLALTIDARSHAVAVTYTPAGSALVFSFAGLADGVASTSRLVNISGRAYGSTGNNVTIGGFVVDGTAPKRFLIRAVGPTLTTQGIGESEVMLDPAIELHDALHGDAVIATNDDWDQNTNFAEIADVAAQIGATAFAPGDHTSSALLATLAPGIYSFVIRGSAGTSGVVLGEVYDADTANTAARLINLSTRARCTTGSSVVIGGFVVAGNAPQRLLVRAIGPTLATEGLDVEEVLPDPAIEVHDARNGNAVIASNDDWGDTAAAADIVSTGARIGATPFAATDTKSSALLLTVRPGIYSFVAHSRDDASGIVLVEVYSADSDGTDR